MVTFDWSIIRVGLPHSDFISFIQHHRYSNRALIECIFSEPYTYTIARTAVFSTNCASAPEHRRENWKQILTRFAGDKNTMYIIVTMVQLVSNIMCSPGYTWVIDGVAKTTWNATWVAGLPSSSIRRGLSWSEIRKFDLSDTTNLCCTIYLVRYCARMCVNRIRTLLHVYRGDYI